MILETAVGRWGVCGFWDASQGDSTFYGLKAIKDRIQGKTQQRGMVVPFQGVATPWNAP